jgi:hypothetical protein
MPAQAGQDEPHLVTGERGRAGDGAVAIGWPLKRSAGTGPQATPFPS